MHTSHVTAQESSSGFLVRGLGRRAINVIICDAQITGHGRLDHTEQSVLAKEAATFAAARGWKCVELEADPVYGEEIEAFRRGAGADALGHGARLCSMDDVRSRTWGSGR